MAESVIALFFILVVFLLAWDAIGAFQTKIFLEHAAARVARARSVGLNRFMCLKSARVATMPVAGESLLDDVPRQAAYNRAGAYLASEDPAEARGILDYELWDAMRLEASIDGNVAHVDVEMPARETPELARLLGEDGVGASAVAPHGSAQIEAHFPLYMLDGGL